MIEKYDIIVVGGGHAGCEAACAAANLGSKVLLITMNIDLVAQMSCNPAVGGIAKGQIVREIDALGGNMGIITDLSMIQFRMLNRSKGPAMWSPRAQNDRMLFSYYWLKTLEKTSNLDLISDVVVKLLIKSHNVYGVRTKTGKEILCKSLILTAGTFLNGKIHIGEISFSGGRMGEESSVGITEQLIENGFESSRLKTGTPVRIDGRTINFSILAEQKGDEIVGKFSYSNTPKLKKQKSCYIAYTSEQVHEILKKGFEKSPLFQGRIQGIGPRYCPSIEDKLIRFADKSQHQLFVEPEGWDTIEYYLNGFSSSLPENIQYEAIHKIKGFEKAKFIKPGYAIEYDYFQPTQLKRTLETKNIGRLFFAGQINGTTGYEEAAGQGIMAGINAHLLINEKPEFTLSRSQAFIGVLIDDLITKGADEPYRMFTSRAEHRILLRQDNADIRLTPLSFSIGLIKKDRYLKTVRKVETSQKTKEFLEQNFVLPKDINPYLELKKSSAIEEKSTYYKLLSRPGVSLSEIKDYSPSLLQFLDKNKISQEIIENTEINIKYQGYISKEKSFAEKLNSTEQIILKQDLDYYSMKNLSHEAREKLSKIKPTTIGQAMRIPGISPSDIATLIILLNI